MSSKRSGQESNGEQFRELLSRGVKVNTRLPDRSLILRRLTYQRFGQGVTQVRLLGILVCEIQRYRIRFEVKCRRRKGWCSWRISLTAHVGVVEDRFTPRAPAVLFVGAYAKLVGGVGFQVVDDRFAGWAGLVDPLPVPLSVADGVEPETRKRQITKGGKWKRSQDYRGSSSGFYSRPSANSPAGHQFHHRASAIQSRRLFQRRPWRRRRLCATLLKYQ